MPAVTVRNARWKIVVVLLVLLGGPLPACDLPPLRFTEDGAHDLVRDDDGDTWVRCADDAAQAGQQGDCDCDDSDPAVFPIAAEVCDDRDNNCDGRIDEGFEKLDYWFDADDDGFGDPAEALPAQCSQPAPIVDDDGHPRFFVENGDDCDDTDPKTNPEVEEVCDGVDNDCDSGVDEGLTVSFYADLDDDRYGDAFGEPVVACQDQPPEGRVTTGDDCDDGDASINPGQLELCNGLDDNCNEQSDETFEFKEYYRDTDNDGYGDAEVAISDCSAPAGYVEASSDCDDDARTVNPGQDELCDGLDNNCNGEVDDTLSTRYYPDADGDGYGRDQDAVDACSSPTDGVWVTQGDDCDDMHASVHPRALEVCDGLDNDCNGEPDDGLTFSVYYPDLDADGYGYAGESTDQSAGDSAGQSTGDAADQSTAYGEDGTAPITACAAIDGYVDQAGDCEDNDPAVHDGANEVCNGIDDDCDGVIDDGLPFSTYFRDGDGDGYGADAALIDACVPVDGYVLTGGDCDDLDPAYHPGAIENCGDTQDFNCDGFTSDADQDGDGWADCEDCAATDSRIHPNAKEVCDGADNDCDGAEDNTGQQSWFLDEDVDGYGGYVVELVAGCPAGWSLLSGDCDDESAAVYPDAPEQCNEVDDDCDGATDESLETSTWYQDRDGDRYGDDAETLERCAQPDGYVATGGDCDDLDAAYHPGASEDCDDTVDFNCDGSVAYADADGDGSAACEDCSDENAEVYPGAKEICNGLDDDCDGSIDDIGLNTWMRDADGDGWPYSFTELVTTYGCLDGWMLYDPTIDALDCNDTLETIHPGAPELCDGLDNDCDDDADESCTEDGAE